MRNSVHSLAILFVIGVFAACHQQQAARVTRGATDEAAPSAAPKPPASTAASIAGDGAIRTGRAADSIIKLSSESDLTSMVICHDTLGRPLVRGAGGAPSAGSRCSPCATYRMEASADASLAHARRLWLQRGRAPHDPSDSGEDSDPVAASCMQRAFKIARSLRPDDDSLAVEMSIVSLAWASDSVRARALRTVDSLAQQRVTEGRRTQAANILTQFGLGVWDRAQRQLERPFQLDVNQAERGAHQLANGAPLLTQLPLIPETSQYLGVSEAIWAARIFDAASQLVTLPADRSRLMRLSLAPWVGIQNWTALDSAARALLQRAPNDSAVLPARALAAYRSMSHPVFSAPSVMALFDSVVKYSPRVDSLRIDGFDGVLTAEDDEWRDGFLPDQRMTLDRRGWSVMDPLWSTPVNEIRLAHRARVVEADYRYADLTKKGESGSETRAGQVLVRRGPPSPWSITEDRDGRQSVERKWQGLLAVGVYVETESNWRMFYGTNFSPARALTFKPASTCISRPEPFLSLYSCAMGMRAEWNDVPFFGQTDDVDVTIARFRSVGDSADTYIGARIPLRAFRSRDDALADRADRIEIGAWLTTELGTPIFHESTKRELPSTSTIAWTHQWTRRVGPLKAMHRVEAMEPRQVVGARGVARFTSDSLASFPTRGFGMSDVLIATSASSNNASPKRWSDLNLQPNGATVAPAERFAMVWEVYDLARGTDGRVHYNVKIKRERGRTVANYGMQQVLTSAASAGSRVVAGESSAPDMNYQRNETASSVVLDNIVFGLGDAAPGNHVVNVTIEDLVSGKSVTRGVSVRMLVPESQKRGTKIRTPAR